MSELKNQIKKISKDWGIILISEEKKPWVYHQYYKQGMHVVASLSSLKFRNEDWKCYMCDKVIPDEIIFILKNLRNE